MGFLIGLMSAAVISLFCFVDRSSGTAVNYIKFRQEIEDALQSERQTVAKQHLHDYLLYRYQHHGEKPVGYSGPPYPDKYLTQPLDHFDQEAGTYQQRYWVNKDHWTGPGGPVFLYIGGEGSLASDIVQAGEHYDLAVKYGALIFAVEHRFYGKSLNPDGLERHNLEYLSSQQALADLASFHSFATTEYGLGEDSTWICFGGSYPGMLAAWFRLKYPHLVFGAIASSAPVLAKVNNEGYNDVVASSLSDPIVNGSELCGREIREAFKTMDNLLDQGAYEKVSNDFKSCSVVEDPKDVHQLVTNVAFLFQFTVQATNMLPGVNITSVCQQMTQVGDSYDKLKNLYQMHMHEKCTDNSWDNYIKKLSNTSHVGLDFSPRAWLYQTCAQFGFYQTCYPETTCLFSRRMTIERVLDICKDAFDIDPEKVYDNVEFTNTYYGADHPGGTRIVFVNGSIDPWHALSVLKNISSTETSIFIVGTSHIANTQPARKTDPASLKLARQEIDVQIGKWLEEAREQFPAKDSKLYFKP